MARIVTAAFSSGCRFTQAQGSLWQYDYGTVLRLMGLELPAAVEIHFATVERGGESETRIGVTADGVTEVKIPDALLEMAKTQDYNLYAFVYLDDGASGQTEYKILMTVRTRPKPGEEHPDTEKDHPLADAVRAVNAAADRAETAAGNAAESKAAAEDAAEQADKSRVAAETVAKHVDEAGRTALTGIASAKTDAAETIETAKTGAVKAVDAARETAIKAVADARTAAEQNLSEAETDGVAAIETAKTEGLQAIDKAKSDIETARSGAIKDIETAKTSGVQAVEAVTAGIEQTKTAAVQAVEAAENEGVAAVNAAVEAGKTNFVTDESLSISGRAADAKIVGDELAKKADQTELEDVKKRQNILVGSETGSRVCVTDAFEAPLEGLVLYGKSTQVTTTGAQLFEPISDSLNLNGVVITFGKNGEKIVVSGTAVLSQEIQISKPIQMQAGEKYVLTLDEVHYFENIWLQGNDVRFGWSGKNTANKVIITVPDSIAERTDCAMYASVKEGEACNFTINHLMLNAGDTALPWEPYTVGKPSPSPDYPQEIQSAGDDGNLSVIVKNPDNEQMQSVSFSTPNSLPGIMVTSGGNYTDENGQQWICDEVDFERGVYRQRIKHVNAVFKKRASSSTHSGYRHIADNMKNMSREHKECLCNIATYSETASNGTEGIRASGEYNTLVLYYENLTDDNVSADVAYILSTPIETPLSETDIAAYRALTTYGPTTILETDGAGMKLDYQQDVNIVIKQLTDTIASITN